MPLIPALGRQEDPHEFWISPGYIESPRPARTIILRVSQSQNYPVSSEWLAESLSQEQSHIFQICSRSQEGVRASPRRGFMGSRLSPIITPVTHSLARAVAGHNLHTLRRSGLRRVNPSQSAESWLYKTNSVLQRENQAESSQGHQHICQVFVGPSKGECDSVNSKVM